MAILGAATQIALICPGSMLRLTRAMISGRGGEGAGVASVYQATPFTDHILTPILVQNVGHRLGLLEVAGRVGVREAGLRARSSWDKLGLVVWSSGDQPWTGQADICLPGGRPDHLAGP